MNLFQQLKSGDQRQLICFPYLGGYANSYFDLASQLSEDIEVWSTNPPGHGINTNKPIQEIQSLLDLYYKELITLIKPNCVFFGHSMGGIIAYFLAQRLMNSGHAAADGIQLVLSACNTPSEFHMTNYFELPNDKLIEHLASYDGIPDELIQEKSLLEYFMPVIRADFKVLETSSTLEFAPLSIPVYYFWGENDKVVSIDSVISWMKYFNNEIHLIPIDKGSHMFIPDQSAIVAKHLNKMNLRM